jgi:iron only hydrogenase large subunit-like protein
MIEEESKPKVAKITLNDCLACSGCVTSAESILIDQQDYREAQRVLKQNQSLDENVSIHLSFLFHQYSSYLGSK